VSMLTVFDVFSVCVQLKLFHSELLSELEQKLELDIKYLTVSGHRCLTKQPTQFTK